MSKTRFITRIKGVPIAAHQATYAEKDAYGSSITLGFTNGRVSSIGGKPVGAPEMTDQEVEEVVDLCRQQP